MPVTPTTIPERQVEFMPPMSHAPMEEVPYDISDQVPLTWYSKSLFFERLRTMVYATGEYSGTLPEVWSTSETIPSAEVEPQDPQSFTLSLEQDEQINTAVTRMHNAGITTAVIEAAHVYMYEDLDDPELRESVTSQAYFAAALTARLGAHDIQTKHLLFVDDYNPDPSDRQHHERLDVAELIALVQSQGYAPELMIREGSMVSLAKDMIRVMDEAQDLVMLKEEDSGSQSSAADILLTRRKVELYRGKDDMVSCAMLDAALTVLKFQYLGEGVVNILPRNNGNEQFSYNGQQRKMRTIVGEHLGARVLPVFNIFIDPQTAAIAAGAHHKLRKECH